MPARAKFKLRGGFIVLKVFETWMSNQAPHGRVNGVLKGNESTSELAASESPSGSLSTQEEDLMMDTQNNNPGVAQGQQHPIGLYLKIWGLLFVLSTLSYLVDFLGFEGYLRWFLIIMFMLMKAGLIMSIFMHLYWERLALVYTILLPPLALLVLVALMSAEADYIFLIRGTFFSP